MTTHPVGERLQAAGLRVATYADATRQGGVHAIMLGLMHTPDCIECRIQVSDGKVAIQPEGRTQAISMLGDEKAMSAPHTFGLATCTCCRGDRWPLTFCLVYQANWPDLLMYMGALLATDMIARPDKYCLRDVATFQARRDN